MRRIREEFNEEISEKEMQSQECCMCGDYGLTFELFSCKVCKNKSQHRYCSIEYPKAASYEICNWCLSQINVPVDDQMEDGKIKINRKGSGGGGGSDDHRETSPEGEKNKGSIMKFRVINNKPVNKSKSLPAQGSPPRQPAAPKRNTVVGSEDDEKLRRTTSGEALQRGTSNIIKKHVFNKKVRRYKLLKEVLC